MYRCWNCREIFDDDEIRYVEVCWEDYYGVGGMFPDRHYGQIAVCPYCGNDEIEEFNEEEEFDEE